MAVIVFMSMVLLSAQCRKNTCGQTIYNFKMAIKAYPDLDSINIGDTIFLEINQSSTFVDIGTNSQVSFTNASNLGTAIGIGELISPNVVTQFDNNDFRYNLINGITIFRADSNNYREYLFAESAQAYHFKLGIIPKKIGTFKLFVSNAANVYRSNDQCTKANFAINFENTNQHLYLNEVSFPGIIPPPGGGIYLFKVK